MGVSGAERSRRGALGERLASCFLELEGSTVLAQRVRIAGVEVDIVARDAGCLVVVEVKLRTTPSFASIDALRSGQIRRLQRAAVGLLEWHRWADAARIDVIAIDWHAHDGRLEVQRLRGVDAR